MDRKNFDNMLLRIGPEALTPGRQGVERRIPVSLIEELLLARELSASLAVPMREAFGLSRQLWGRTRASGAPDLGAAFIGSVPLGEYIQLGVDLARLREELQARLEHAVESVVRPPRGRPARARGTRLGDA